MILGTTAVSDKTQSSLFKGFQIWFLSGFLFSNVTLILYVGHCIMRLRKNYNVIGNAEENIYNLTELCIRVKCQWQLHSLLLWNSTILSYLKVEDTHILSTPLLFLKFFFLTHCWQNDSDFFVNRNTVYYFVGSTVEYKFGFLSFLSAETFVQNFLDHLSIDSRESDLFLKFIRSLYCIQEVFSPLSSLFFLDCW